MLLSSAAFAQTEPPAPGAMPVLPPPDGSGDASIPIEPEHRMPHDRVQTGPDAEPTRGRGERRGRGPRGRHADAGGHGGGGHHGYHHGHHGSYDGGRGATFHFSQGAGGPSFNIRCAADDSTVECVQAVLPMLERVLRAAPPATTP